MSCNYENKKNIFSCLHSVPARESKNYVGRQHTAGEEGNMSTYKEKKDILHNVYRANVRTIDGNHIYKRQRKEENGVKRGQ